MTRDQIIQKLIDKICNFELLIEQLQTTTNNINTVINNSIGDFLNTSINTCSGTGIKKTGLGKDFKLTITGFAPPQTYLPYGGPLEYFDASGKGLDGTPACGWYIANGQNGTLDLRGYTWAGATQGVGGGQYDARVDPDKIPGAATKYGDKKGEVNHLLTLPEIPSHSHLVNDPGHSHINPNLTMMLRDVRCSTSNCQSWWPGGDAISVGSAKTGITLGNAGGSQPHNNIQPTFFGVWIVRFD